jgi:hypothetical protein
MLTFVRSKSGTLLSFEGYLILELRKLGFEFKSDDKGTPVYGRI